MYSDLTSMVKRYFFKDAKGVGRVLDIGRKILDDWRKD